jgi:hypothetical protein
MTIEEKRDKLFDFCNEYDSCKDCVLNELCECGRGVHFEVGSGMSDEEIKQAYAIVFGTEPIKDKINNPYWENICKLQDKQRKKGIETYGQGLEDNHQPVLVRIQHIEEELIDALMYLEWLKDKLGGMHNG